MRNSPLTIHGSLQADRLGKFFASTGLVFTHIFSSNLQRAAKTAEAIRLAQKKPNNGGVESELEVTRLPVLREQDFGVYEGKPFHARVRNLNKPGKDNHGAQHLATPDFKDVESKDSMASRMNSFLDAHLIPLLQKDPEADRLMIAVVSHGIILSILWKCIINRFSKQSVQLAPGLSVGSGGATPLEHLCSWSNTGYLDLEVQCPVTLRRTGPSTSNVQVPFKRGMPITAQDSSLLSGWIMTIKTVNGKEHLRNLKRIGGGVGSSKYDEGQKKIETFFKKRRNS